MAWDGPRVVCAGSPFHPPNSTSFTSIPTFFDGPLCSVHRNVFRECEDLPACTAGRQLPMWQFASSWAEPEPSVQSASTEGGDGYPQLSRNFSVVFPKASDTIPPPAAQFEGILEPSFLSIFFFKFVIPPLGVFLRPEKLPLLANVDPHASEVARRACQFWHSKAWGFLGT